MMYKDSITYFVVKILGQSTKPLSSREILDSLAKYRKPRSADPLATIRSICQRSEYIRRDSRGHYTLSKAAKKLE